jgi:hypothetical protein
MANLRERGRAFRNRAAPLAAGVTLTAERLGEAETTRCTIVGAVVGNTKFVSTERNVARIEYGERDYYIPAGSYLLGVGNTVSPPAERDRLRETINGVEYLFEVRPPANEPAWRYMDGGRTLLRVHVKRLKDDT